MFPALLLIIATIVLRVISGLAIISGTTWVSNFAPLAAIALCSAAYLPWRYKFTVPFAALITSDAILNWYYRAPLLGVETSGRYAAFALICCLGMLLRRRPSLRTLLPASLVASVVFYAITNTLSWATEPGYAKNVAGWTQALTIGLPVNGGATPTWMFFRNSLLSDLFFTTVFVACMKFGRRHVATIETRQALPRTA